MQQPRLTPAQRYGPFAALVVAVALLLVVAPSKSPSRTNEFAGAGDDGIALSTGAERGRSIGEAAGPGGVDEVAATGEAALTDASGAPIDPSTPAGSTGGASASTGTGAAGPGATAPRASAPAGTANRNLPPGVTGEDCSRRELLGRTATCKPIWNGTNGGATYKGATATALTVAFYLTKADPAVNAVLAGGGLASSREEQRREIATYTDFFQKNSQTWGRKITMVVVEGTADIGEAAAFRADAVKIDQEIKAGLVLGAGNADMIDELARRGIPCICGAQFSGKFHRDHAPFVYGILPDGDTTNKHITEYICKRLGAGSKADFSGEVIHPTIGAKGQVVRRYGLAYPNGEFGSNNAKDLKARLQAGCGVTIASEVGYASDINTAVQQSTANTQTSIRDKITTVICICDPLAPIFATQAATQQRYFPEWLMTGYLLQDAEALARLYDQEQWRHSFGVSSLPAPVKKEESRYFKVYKAQNPGSEPNAASAPLIFPSIQIAFAGIELAGTTYNPKTFNTGMNAIDVVSQNKTETTFGYGPDDFGGIDDFREVWWDPDGRDVNGAAGVYQGVADHYRHKTGAWPTGKTLAFRRDCLAPGACGSKRY